MVSGIYLLTCGLLVGSAFALPSLSENEQEEKKMYDMKETSSGRNGTARQAISIIITTTKMVIMITMKIYTTPHHTHARTYARTHTHIPTHTDTYTDTHTHTDKHTHRQTHTHTHTHTHTSTHTHLSLIHI